MTGAQYTIHCFRNGDDLSKSWIFSVNKRHWSSIREEVLAWTRLNWTKWVETKPEWFTEAFKEGVPDDMMPPEAFRQLNMKGVRGIRRRSSVGVLQPAGRARNIAVRVVPIEVSNEGPL